MKVNKIDNDDILSYNEFIAKYKDELKESIEKGDISQELIDNLANTMLNHKKALDSKYSFIIQQIYIAIVETKYREYPNGYKGSIYKLVKYISFLCNDWDFYVPDYEELCYEIYDTLLNWNAKGLNVNPIMEEEFKPEHLLDIDYQLDNLKKYSTRKEFLEELDKQEWRMIQW